MRNLKKILAVITIVAIMVTMAMVPALAASYTYESEATTLNTLGLMAGMNLGDSVTRIQGLTFAIKAAGKNADVQAMTDADVTAALANVVDKDTIPAWGLKYAAYAVKNNYTAGVGGVAAPSIKFGGNTIISGGNFLAWVLKIGMGYSTTNPGTAVADAVAAKIITINQAVAFGGKLQLVRDDVAGILYGAAKNGVNKDGKTFIQSLIDSGFVTAQAAATAGVYTIVPPAPVALGVSNVTALNLKEITVTFNQAVDKDTAETKTNYTFSGIANTVISATLNGNTVDLVLNADEPNQSTVDVTVKNVKTADKSATIADTTVKSVAFLDTSLPTVKSVTVTGPKSVDVAFSEPMETLPTFKIDSGNYYAAPTLSTDGKTVTLTYGVELSEGAHTVTVKDGADYAGFKVAEVAMPYTYAKDKAVPTVSVDKTTETVVTLLFSKKVKATNLNTDVTAYYAYNNDNNFKATLAAVEPDANGFATKYTATFARAIPSSTQTLYLNTKADKLEDTWGNDIASTTLSFTVVTDNVKPVVSSVTTDGDKKILVVFSEDVTKMDAETKGYFTLYKADGTTLVKDADFSGVDDSGHFDAATLAYVSADKKLTITTTANIPAGNYVLKIEKIRDLAYVKNTMDAATFNVTITDKTGPSVSGAILGDGGKKIRVTFSENMATDGLTTLSNYRVSVNAAASVALDDKATVTIVDTKTIEIALPALIANLDGTNDAIEVGGTLKDTAGNTIGGFFASKAIASDAIEDANIATDSEQLTAKNTVIFKVDQQLSAIDASKIRFNDGDATEDAVASAYYVNDSGKATITVVFKTEVKTDKTGLINVTLEPGAVTNVFGTKNLVNMVVANADVDDKVAPEISKVEAVGVKAIDVTFTEAINADTVSIYTFSVAGNTVTAIGWTGNVLNLTLKDAIGTDATPAVTQSLDLADSSGNKKLAGTSVSETADKIAATATAKIVNGTTVDVLFSEKVDETTAEAAAYTIATAAGADVETLTSATLQDDGKTVRLVFAGATIVATDDVTVPVTVKDASTAGNVPGGALVVNVDP